MKKALVSGGNRGIGLAIAEGLAAKGIEVIIGSRHPQEGINDSGQSKFRCVELDLLYESSIEAAVIEAGGVDILINNAGVLGSGGLFDDPLAFDEALKVMVSGPYHLIHRCLPHMKQNGFGRIINISSGWGAFSSGVAGPGAYGVSKAALNAITVSAARSLPREITINAVCPGWVATRMGGLGAPRTPADGADTAIWLATDEKNAPTGLFFRDRQSIEW